MPELFEFQSFVIKQIVLLYVLLILNLKGHHNGIIGSKVTTYFFSFSKSVFLNFLLYAKIWLKHGNKKSI